MFTCLNKQDGVCPFVNRWPDFCPISHDKNVDTVSGQVSLNDSFSADDFVATQIFFNTCTVFTLFSLHEM